MAHGPLRKRTREDGRCPARTGDLLLVRRERVLRRTAVCCSGRPVGDVVRIRAVLRCGLREELAIRQAPAGINGLG